VHFVEDAQRVFAGTEASYTTTIRLLAVLAVGRSARMALASISSMIWVDAMSPNKTPKQYPLNVLLNPGESVIATRKFIAPADAQKPGLVVAHGRFPGMLIIGDDQSLFHKQSVVRFE
jgi:hypothetical protein